MSEPRASPSSTFVFQSLGNDLVIECAYDPTALAWIDMYDQLIIGWMLDATVAGADPVPVYLGTPPPPPANTGAVVSPQWAFTRGVNVFVPDKWRGSIEDFFTYMATNNGANRQLRGTFMISANLFNSWTAWANKNPALVWSP